MSLISTKCGFDDKFFQLLEKKFNLLSSEQLHGILVFDEIFLRESLSVNTSNLTYIGLEDLGNGVVNDKLEKKADHGLVFLFRSLSSNYSQPIAMFASKGPVAGKFVFKKSNIILISRNFHLFIFRSNYCSIDNYSDWNARKNWCKS